MHAVQKNFIRARLIFDDIRQRVNAEHAAFVKAQKLDIMNDAHLDAICNDAATRQEKYGYTPALDAMLDAQKKLLAWGREQMIANLPRYPQFKQYEKDFDKLFDPRCLPSIREQVTELVLRMRPDDDEHTKIGASLSSS